MDTELLDTIAALALVGLAVWWLLRSLRGPSSCASCPPKDGDRQRGKRVAVGSLSLGRKHRG